MFYLVGIFRASSPGGSISSSKLLWGGKCGESGYREVLQQKVSSLNVLRLLLIKENHLALFFIWGDSRIWSY